MYKVFDFPGILLPDLTQINPDQFQQADLYQADICIDFWFSLILSQDPWSYPEKLFIAVSQEAESCEYEPLDNVIHVIGCHSEFEKQKSREDFVGIPTWFVTTRRANQSALQKKISKNLKEYHCDFLLGGQTLNRIRLLDLLKSHDLLDKCLINLRSRQHSWGLDNLVSDNSNVYTSEILSFLDPQGFESCYDPDGKIFTMRQDTTVENLVFFSQLIPWKIYDKTMISFVAETESLDPATVFFTEKTAKPLLAGRPFVLFAAPGTLSVLKNYGFCTFHPWIDETYDLVADPAARLNMAFDSFLEFAKKTDREKSEILTDLELTLDHNRRVISDSKKWLQPLVEKIYQWTHFPKAAATRI